MLDPAEQNLKVPAWLNDVTLYHNRGNTTFVDEDSYYGDFFGLDDLFTEHPRVVDGMIDVYQTWIGDLGIDGFRIDTMKHVNDEFWQKFGPEVLAYAKSVGKQEFFMFGEVFDTTKSFTSQFTTRDKMQAVLDFPFQEAARNFASKSMRTDQLRDFFNNDDWYTDADSNVYQLPTFLGNHDMGRIGFFVKADNEGALEDELVARDRLAHELMYFSRGNPVVYYGDEQGFTGTGGDQVARQTMFASQVADYLDDDLLGTTNTHAQDNFVTTHPLYQKIHDLALLHNGAPGTAQRRAPAPVRQRPGGNLRVLAAAPRRAAGVRRRAQQQRVGEDRGRSPPMSRTGPSRGSTDQARRPSPPTAIACSRSPCRRCRPWCTNRTIGSRAPTRHRSISLDTPAPSAETNSRMLVSANVGGSSFNEVTFYAKVGNGNWTSIGTDDTRPYRVFHDISSIPDGTAVGYQRGRAATTPETASQCDALGAVVPPPALTIKLPAEGAGVFGKIEVRVLADPERSSHVVQIQRRLTGGDWETLTTDSSSPIYSYIDDLAAVPVGTTLEYRAILDEPDGTHVVSAVRTVTRTEPQPLVPSVTVAGSVQSEMGCPGDWDPACDASDMTFDTSDGLWKKTVTLPAGDYEWKVAINNTWDINYGAGGAAGGGNIALPLPATSSVTFIWDQVSHIPTATVG